MITPSSYSENLSKSEKTVAEKIETYLTKPNEENVHDLRTSIRRLLTIANLLPKKTRTNKQFQKTLSRYEKLLKINTKARDMDIILSKLPKHGDDPVYAKLVKQIGKLRELSIRKGQRFASSLRDSKKATLPSGEIPAEMVRKRFKRTTGTLAKQVKKHLRVVTDEPKNMAELHKLREDSRRLRFALELDDSPSTSRLLPVLETWQEVLGKIRDSDIFVSRFEHEKNTSTMGKLVDHERAERNENYERFLEIARESPKLSIG